MPRPSFVRERDRCDSQVKGVKLSLQSAKT